MTHLNTDEKLVSLKYKSIWSHAKFMPKLLVSSALLIAGMLISGDVVAETSDGNLPEAEEPITAQQQQELIDWNLKAQASLSKRLDTKLHKELTSMLHHSNGLLDNQVPGIDLPTQQLLCAGKSTSVPPGDTRNSLGRCYVSTPQ